MSLTIPQLLVMLGAALLAVALFAPRMRIDPKLPAVAVVAAVDENTAAPQPASSRVAWPELVDVHAAHLDDRARRALLEALIAIGEPWCVPILRAARDEERDDVLATLASAGLDAISASDVLRIDAA
jgi:uncharacterized membrane protein